MSQPPQNQQQQQPYHHQLAGISSPQHNHSAPLGTTATVGKDPNKALVDDASSVSSVASGFEDRAADEHSIGNVQEQQQRPLSTTNYQQASAAALGQGTVGGVSQKQAAVVGGGGAAGGIPGAYPQQSSAAVSTVTSTVGGTPGPNNPNPYSDVSNSAYTQPQQQQQQQQPPPPSYYQQQSPPTYSTQPQQPPPPNNPTVVNSQAYTNTSNAQPTSLGYGASSTAGQQYASSAAAAAAGGSGYGVHDLTNNMASMTVSSGQQVPPYGAPSSNILPIQSQPPQQQQYGTTGFAAGYGPAQPPPHAKPPATHPGNYYGPSSGPTDPNLGYGGMYNDQAHIQQQPPQIFPAVIGPALQFTGTDTATATWSGSVLVLINDTPIKSPPLPQNIPGYPPQPPPPGAGGNKNHNFGPGYGSAPNPIMGQGPPASYGGGGGQNISTDFETIANTQYNSMFSFNNYGYSQPPLSASAGPPALSPGTDTTSQTPGVNLKPPIVQIWDDGVHGPGEGKPKEYFANKLYTDVYSGYTFWRTDIKVHLEIDKEKKIWYKVIWNGTSPNKYSNENDDNVPTHEFYVPSQSGTWRFCAFGNTEIMDPAEIIRSGSIPHSRSPLWTDLSIKHAQRPFHLMIGTGGQISGEGVWDECRDVLRPFFHCLHSTQPGLNISRVQWTHDMDRAVEQYYFNRYIKVWFPSLYMRRDGVIGMSDMLSQIPYSFVIDDFDIFSNWGSLPDEIHRSPVVANIGRIAIKYWCLFQVHTHSDIAFRHGFIGRGYHWLRQLSPFTAILGLDTRTERTMRDILSIESHNMLMNYLETHLNPNTRQLLIVVPNPVIFPHTQTVENIINGADSFGMLSIANMMVDKFASGPSDSKRKKALRAENRFGKRDFALKLSDQWTSTAHSNERDRFILRLQDLSRRRVVRISFLSGHVNFAGCGCMQSFATTGIDQNSVDWRLMLQVFVSGIVDTPVDSTTLYAYYRSASRRNFDQTTSEKFYKTFISDVHLNNTQQSNKKFIARRSYVIFEEVTAAKMFELDIEHNPSFKGLVGYLYYETPGPIPIGRVKIDIPPHLSLQDHDRLMESVNYARTQLASIHGTQPPPPHPQQLHQQQPVYQGQNPYGGSYPHNLPGPYNYNNNPSMGGRPGAREVSDISTSSSTPIQNPLGYFYPRNQQYQGSPTGSLTPPPNYSNTLPPPYSPPHENK
ncbi:hypothetical protein H4219_005267 [Mycoemilia scoparia]|uniref:PhoD-like phosphatase domain-containing protein n=1 Tax=Mycoemilia scoparia TaxID=417184 RepID=A0A9W8DQE3_9FUNG|nr:hypothetical protein H4219_005267 [Mycoemilia scoparia]